MLWFKSDCIFFHLHSYGQSQNGISELGLENWWKGIENGIRLWLKLNLPKIILENESNRKLQPTTKMTKIEGIAKTKDRIMGDKGPLWHVPVAIRSKEKEGSNREKRECFQTRKLELMLRKSVNSKASVLVIYYTIIFILVRYGCWWFLTHP